MRDADPPVTVYCMGHLGNQLAAADYGQKLQTYNAQQKSQVTSVNLASLSPDLRTGGLQLAPFGESSHVCDEVVFLMKNK